MATVLNILTRALQRINVVDSGEDADADDAESALAAYNEMLFSWVNDAVDVNHAEQTLTDTFVLDNKHQQGVIALLAVRLADDYDEDPTAKLLKDAEGGWIALQADYQVKEPPRFDAALTKLPSQRHYYRNGT